MAKAPIVFLSVPESFAGGKGQLSTNFEVDPSIPLPVEQELTASSTSDFKSGITTEAIISGMLRIITSSAETEQVPAQWIDYYRRFVFAVKPEIYHEFTSASIVKTKNGEYDLALEINSSLEALFPQSPGVLLNKALILENRAAAVEKSGRDAAKENDEAEKAFESVLSQKPVLPDALFNAGFFFMRRKDFIRSRECFTLYVEAVENAEILDEAGENKKRRAKKIIREIAGQGLDDFSYQQALDCVRRGNDAEGLLKTREFIERHPKAPNGWFLLGWALRKLGRYSDGIEALRKAVELGGSNCEIQNEIAICMIELGNFKGAKKELEKALREDPENTKIISNLGVLAQKNGSLEEAAAFFRTVLELDPDDPLAKHFYESFS